MSKCKSLFSLVLSVLLLFGLFSVNVYASEESENLVDSDILNWTDLSDTFDTLEPIYIRKNSSAGISFYRIGWGTSDYPQNVPVGSISMIYNLTNLVVGDNYNLSFKVSASILESVSKMKWTIGLGYIDSLGTLTFVDDSFVELSPSHFSIFGFSQSAFVNFDIPFTYSERLGKPCIAISCIVTEKLPNASSCQINILENSLVLSRSPSETEKKLDGVLGWLEDIKNSIVGLPETIKTNFQTFFSNLENKINDFKNTVTEKFTTLSNEFSSYITNLGNNIKGFFDDLWSNISEWFEKFKPRIEIPLTFFDYGNYYSSDLFIPYSDKFHLQLPFAWYLDVYDLNGNYVNYIYVTENFDYQFLKSDYTEYLQFRIRISDNGYTLPDSIYVDDGWLSALFDGFKYQFYSLKIKIDLKIEEIKQSLHDLFIPDEDFFENLSNSFRDIAEERFGALFTVVDLLDNFLTSFDADKTTEFIVIPVYTFDILGYPFVFGGWQFRFIPDFPVIKEIVSIIKGFTNIIITFAFLGGLKSKYDEIFGGD